MFRKQCTLAAMKERGLRELCSFVVIVYIKAWFSAPSAIQAPRHNLILMKTPLHYKVINSSISKSISENCTAICGISQKRTLVCLYSMLKSPSNPKEKLCLQ